MSRRLLSLRPLRLLAWVSGLDKALGNPESSAAIADGSRKQVIQNLTDVCRESLAEEPDTQRRKSADRRPRHSRASR